MIVKTYQPGRRCACGTVLSIYNSGSRCSPCVNHRCGPPASACSEAAPAAAPPARTTKEEKVGKEILREGPRTAVLMVFARDPSRTFSPGDVQKSTGAAPSCVYKHLKALVASGELVKRAPGVYRWPKTEDAKTAPATVPAPAPVTSEFDPEQPANVAPASGPLPPQARPAPFAGIDRELVVIGEVVRRIESLTGHETCVRVAAYVGSRFLP